MKKKKCFEKDANLLIQKLWQILREYEDRLKRIIEVTNEIKKEGSSAGSTSEIIVAAFILTT